MTPAHQSGEWLKLLGLDSGDGAVVDGLVDLVLIVLGIVNDDLGNAVIVDGEHVSSGGLAQTAADALFVNGNLHDRSSHSCRAHAPALDRPESPYGPTNRTPCPFHILLYTLRLLYASIFC